MSEASPGLSPIGLDRPVSQEVGGIRMAPVFHGAIRDNHGLKSLPIPQAFPRSSPMLQ
jgi:hypothetical protein